MLKLEGQNIYLSTLEKEHCQKLWCDFEYDFTTKTERLNLGHSVEKADQWFDEIQKLQGNKNVRLGIFQMNNTVIGDVALQDIDWENGSCSIGMGIAKIENRNKGYGKEAVHLILNYAFYQLGLERITANTLDINISAQHSLERTGFVLEGKERKAVYLFGEKHDKYNYGLLSDEYINERSIN